MILDDHHFAQAKKEELQDVLKAYDKITVWWSGSQNMKPSAVGSSLP